MSPCRSPASRRQTGGPARGDTRPRARITASSRSARTRRGAAVHDRSPARSPRAVGDGVLPRPRRLRRRVQRRGACRSSPARTRPHARRRGRHFLDGSAYLSLFWKSLQMSAIVSVVSRDLRIPGGLLPRLRPAAVQVRPAADPPPARSSTSFLLRVLAWQVILRNKGVINSLLWMDCGRGRRHLMADLHLVLGRPGARLRRIPFVALPIFVVMENMDRRLIEAASDLGASRLAGVPPGHAAAVAAGRDRRLRLRADPDHR